VKKIVFVIVRVIQGLFILCLVYLLVLIGIIVWTFEVKLQRWPTFVYTAPFSVQVGDDLVDARFMERLVRLGYTRSPSVTTEPGQWSQLGSNLNIYLKHSPLVTQGITTGPVSITLDWNRVRSIRLMRSFEEVNRIVLEPELLSVFPASGYGMELCRSISLDKIPPLLVDAIVLTEDPRFFAHQGIDLFAIGQALKENWRAGRYVQGGSTIPQQLIRMTILTPEKKMGRKVNEILLALIANAIYSKKTILEAYLNRVYFGQWGPFPIQGVAEAASHLFGKDLDELDAAECSLMAATICGPGLINPHSHFERAQSRRNVVLGLLFKAGKISREQFEEGVRSPVRMRKAGQPPVKAPSFLDLVKDSLAKHQTEPSGMRQDVITSLDPLMQTEAELTLKRMGKAGIQAHLILANPITGDLRAFISPGASRWSGTGGSLETFLPLLTIPALIPEKQDRPKYTLTSQVFATSRTGGPMTFRAAFRNERTLLAQRLISGEEDKMLAVLKEFGVSARLKGAQDLEVDPVSPMEMAQTYSLVAALGNAAPLGPGVRIVGEPPSDAPVERKRVTVKPAVLFLVNHLMKNMEMAEAKDTGSGKNWEETSLFTTRDKDGLWKIDYRSDSLLVSRIPGGQVDGVKMGKILDSLFQKTGLGTEGLPVVPDGIVFRKICVQSGLRATSICPRVIREPFLRGTQPDQWCPQRHGSEAVSSGQR
jgi:penicillin-binding protein 1B